MDCKECCKSWMKINTIYDLPENFEYVPFDTDTTGTCWDDIFKSYKLLSYENGDWYSSETAIYMLMNRDGEYFIAIGHIDFNKDSNMKLFPGDDNYCFYGAAIGPSDITYNKDYLYLTGKIDARPVAFQDISWLPTLWDNDES